MSRFVTIPLLLMLFSTEAFAFQPCPLDTRPCASLSQVFTLLLLPSLITFFAAWIINSKIHRAWLKYTVITIISIVWLFWLVLTIGLFNAYLAPCSASCWYHLFG